MTSAAPARLLTRALAGEIGGHIETLSGSQFVGMYAGDSAQSVREGSGWAMFAAVLQALGSGSAEPVQSVQVLTALVAAGGFGSPGTAQERKNA